MATTVSDAPYESDYASDVDVDRGIGWVLFAAIMLGLSSAWNVFEGIAAIFRSHVYVANATYVFSDLRTWGWIVLGLGVLEGFAAIGITTGSQMARWFGVGAASLNAIGQLLFVQAYPFWSISMFTIDMLVIYGLAVYGGRQTTEA